MQILDHNRVCFVCQSPADVVGVVGSDVLALTAQPSQLAPHSAVSDRPSALARQVPLLALYLRIQGRLIGHPIEIAITVGDLPDIAIQAQHPGLTWWLDP